MYRPFFGSLLGCLLGLAVPLSAHAQAPGRPAGNPPSFVIILCDDLGYGDLGCYGSTTIRTPNVDRMAAEGMRFTDFYVGASICSPSRAALLTGRYPRRTGILGALFPHSPHGLSPKLPTLSSVLKEHGYATACVGKWHLGHRPAFLPMAHGFEHYFGIPYSNDMGFAPELKLAPRVKPPTSDGPPLMRDDEVIEVPAQQDTLTRRYTDESIRFLTANKHRPFFLYLAFTSPHFPLHVSPFFRGRSKRGLYGDVVEELDASTGEILATLRRLGRDKDTLVLFTSDNGPWLQKKEYGGSAGPLRDGKFSAYEGGFRMPAIFWWPGRVPTGQTCREVASTIDLLPTYAALAGAAVPDGLDGKDIRPLLFGAPGAQTPHRAYLYDSRAVRSGRWKLVRDKHGDELFDLVTDPGERKNLAGAKPEKVRELAALLPAKRPPAGPRPDTRKPGG
jgi:arylsulfatase/arylsulfatase A